MRAKQLVAQIRIKPVNFMIFQGIGWDYSLGQLRTAWSVAHYAPPDRCETAWHLAQYFVF